jgi:hypothetical protein
MRQRAVGAYIDVADIDKAIAVAQVAKVIHTLLHLE